MNMERMHGEAGMSKRLMGGVLAGALAVGLVGYNQLGTNDKAPEAAAADTSEDIADLFRIDTITADCMDIASAAGTAEVNTALNVVEPEVGALKPVNAAGGQENRLWSDAISNPLTTGPEAESLETEIKASLCEDALFAVTVANHFANMEVDGVNIGELNEEWLGEYAGGQEEINDKAAELLPLLDHEGEVSSEQADAALEANQKHQDLAERLATLLDRLSNEGVHVEETALNYHLAAAGMVVGQLPEVELNGTQYSGEMLLFIGEAKDGRCLVRLGFNVQDQRPVLTSEDCAPEETTTVPEGGETTTTGPGRQTTTTRPGQTTTTRPGETTTTTRPTTSTTESDKDPSLDYNNGTGPNNGPGSGGTAGPTGTTSTTERPAPDPTAPETTTTVAGGSTTSIPTEPYEG